MFSFVSSPFSLSTYLLRNWQSNNTKNIKGKITENQHTWFINNMFTKLRNQLVPLGLESLHSVLL